MTPHIAAIDTQGYTVLPGLLPKEQVESIRAALSPWLQKRLMGRNNFEGTCSERVYALLAKSTEIACLIEHPEILSLMDHFLADNYLLSANLAINVHPGETPQPWHADHASVPNVDRRTTNGMSVIWAIDEFTESNGATEVLAQSHRWDSANPISNSELIKVCMPAGSALVFHGSLIHRGGPNQSQTSRLAITPQYCQPWLRQLENMPLAVPAEIAAQYSARVQELLGYSIREPGFMGYVDGLHPRRLLDANYEGRHARGLES